MTRMMFRLVPLTFLVLAGTALAQTNDSTPTAPPAPAQSNGPRSDTQENRIKLARQLIDIQSPEMDRAMHSMVDNFERSMPPELRPRFRASFDKVFDVNKAREYSAMVMAKDLNTDELAALVAFYSSPVGHSAMSKMPQVMQDTAPFMRAVMEQAMRQLPSDLRPPQFKDL